MKWGSVVLVIGLALSEGDGVAAQEAVADTPVVATSTVPAIPQSAKTPAVSADQERLADKDWRDRIDQRLDENRRLSIEAQETALATGGSVIDWWLAGIAVIFTVIGIGLPLVSVFQYRANVATFEGLLREATRFRDEAKDKATEVGVIHSDVLAKRDLINAGPTPPSP